MKLAHDSVAAVGFAPIILPLKSTFLPPKFRLLRPSTSPSLLDRVQRFGRRYRSPSNTRVACSQQAFIYLPIHPMDTSIYFVWGWFQWILIRLALFLALLTLGPSLGLILFDILLYAYRTTFDGFMGKKGQVEAVKETRVTQLKTSELEVKKVEQVETVKSIEQ